MKKFSQINEQKRKELKETVLLNEQNLYLVFSKKYNKEHGVSGPFDAKFKGDKKKQKAYMSELGKAWSEHKAKQGIKKKDKNKSLKESMSQMNEAKASDMAKEMSGDGGDPNYHFVTMSDDYLFEQSDELVQYSKNPNEAPLKIKTTIDMGAYTFGPFLSVEEARAFASSIELDEINGPRMVKIEDRKNGDVCMRYLTCRMQPTWSEAIDVIAEQEQGEIEDQNAHSIEDIDTVDNKSYTYGDNEDE